MSSQQVYVPTSKWFVDTVKYTEPSPVKLKDVTHTDQFPLITEGNEYFCWLITLEWSTCTLAVQIVDSECIFFEASAFPGQRELLTS